VRRFQKSTSTSRFRGHRSQILKPQALLRAAPPGALNTTRRSRPRSERAARYNQRPASADKAIDVIDEVGAAQSAAAVQAQEDDHYQGLDATSLRSRASRRDRVDDDRGRSADDRRDLKTVVFWAAIQGDRSLVGGDQSGALRRL